MSMGKATYIRYFLRNAPWVIKQRIDHKPKKLKRFNGYKGLSVEMTSTVLEQAILSGKSFCAIRFGAVELSCLNNHEKIEFGFAKDYKESVRFSMKNNAGYYPIDFKHLEEYGDQLLGLLKNVDYLGISGINMEDYFHMKYCPQAQPILYKGMEPLIGNWTKALKGKKVLVISPYSEEIQFQYARRRLLFPGNDEILPEFGLTVLNCPQTLGSVVPPTPSFFRSLELLEEAMERVDFDILLVGAGAYGTFLAVKAKQMGKQAVQTGGATMTLFGLIGKRWENRPYVKKWINPAWIRPYTKPEGYEKVEGGCYW